MLLLPLPTNPAVIPSPAPSNAPGHLLTRRSLCRLAAVCSAPRSLMLSLHWLHLLLEFFGFWSGTSKYEALLGQAYGSCGCSLTFHDVC